ncbi:MAG: segregation/condensation protein A [Bdellovibrionales bacterium]|nr:segregation/condensation protein A [Bdellovibrionales bacterium]
MSLTYGSPHGTPRNTQSDNISIRLEQFEGPLDLLLYLIQSQELDISTISISKITDQYLNALRLMQELNFDLASEFLVMAATLILWKSKALMPKEEDPNALLEDSALPLTQEDLVRQLLNRQRYLEMAATMATRPLMDYDIFTRPNKRPPVTKIWKEMNVTQLATTLQDLLIREQRRARVVMKKETVSLAQKLTEMGSKLTLGQLTALKDFIKEETRGEYVVSFLASLELSRLKKVRLHQNQVFDPIFLELIAEMINFDTRQAQGFEYVRTDVDPTTGAKTVETAHSEEPTP